MKAPFSQLQFNNLSLFFYIAATLLPIVTLDNFFFHLTLRGRHV